MDSDLYAFEELLPDEDRALLHRVRDFLSQKVEPVITDHWIRGEFPHDLIPGLAELGIAGLTLRDHGCPGRSVLLDGMIAMELTRTDASVATFLGAHSGLAMRAISECGSDEQRERWLPAMARLDAVGAFGLTEPDVGSGAAGELATAARRDGADWVLSGQKKWIGNASFADVIVLWARDEADGEVKGFLLEPGLDGLDIAVQQDKIALRAVQNATITLSDVRIPDTVRLPGANSFADAANVLRLARAGVAWMATGCMRGAYDHALRYCKEREQFGQPIGGFQLVQDQLVSMLGSIVSCTALCVRLAELQQAGDLTDERASLAKVVCTVAMRDAVRHARELLGGNGILLEYHVGRFVADAEAIYSYEGTREINTLIVGRAITGESAFV